MSKKNFTGGLNTLLGDQTDKPKKKLGRPTTSTRVITKSSQEGTKENETRATFIVREDLLESLKAISYWERILIKQVLNRALENEVASYKKKNGELKPIPKK